MFCSSCCHNQTTEEETTNAHAIVPASEPASLPINTVSPNNDVKTRKDSGYNKEPLSSKVVINAHSVHTIKEEM